MESGTGVNESPRRKLLPFWIFFGLILLSGLLIRSSGLMRDAPFAVHCDAPKLVEIVKSQVGQRSLGYISSGYPVGHMQIPSAVGEGLRLFADWIGLPLNLDDRFFFLLSRMLVTLLGVLGLAFVMLAGRSLFGPWAGLLAGALLATDQMSFIHGHHVLGDMPQGVFVAGSFYFASLVLKKPSRAASFWAGLLAGAAAATKYHGGYIAVTALCAHALAKPRRLGGIPWLVLGAAFGFVLLIPAIWVDGPLWIKYLCNEFTNQGNLSILAQSEFLPWVGRGLARTWAIWRDNSHFVAWLWLPSLIILAVKPRREDWLLLLAILPTMFIVIIVRSAYLRDWDFLVMVPLIYLCIAGAAWKVWTRWGWLNRPAPRKARQNWPRWLLACGLGGLLLAQGWQALELGLLYQLPDTRRMASAWLQHRLPRALSGQRFMVDMTFPSMERLHTSSHYYPLAKGYEYYQPEKGAFAECRRIKKDKLGSEIPYALIHQLPAVRKLWCLPPSRAVAEFGLRSFGEYNPTIQVFEMGPAILAAPWRRSPARPAGWEPAVSLSVPASFRETRQVLMGKKPVSRLVVSKKPLGYLAVSLMGRGLVSITHGGREYQTRAGRGRPVVVLLQPARCLPPMVNAYKLELKAKRGPVLAGLLAGKAAVAHGLWRAGRWQEAAGLYALAAGEGKLIPQDYLAWAACLLKSGRGKEAAEVRAKLKTSRPAFARALVKVMSAPDYGAATKALASGLGASPRVFGMGAARYHWHLAQATTGRALPPCAGGEGALNIPPDKPGWSKYWLPDSFSAGYLRAVFELELLEAPSEGPAGKVDLYGHFGDKLLGVLAQAEIANTLGPQKLELRFAAHELPLKLEARIYSEPGASLVARVLGITADAPAELAALARQAGMP